MGINNDYSAPKAGSAEYVSQDDPQKKKVKKKKEHTAAKDSVEFKNADTLERTKPVSKDGKEANPDKSAENAEPVKLKKANPFKLFFNKFKKKPKCEKNYNYENNPPPYDK